ncbi:cupredoxin domain-containing protein [Roseobacter sp. YSTF-M11]|uniref:Cupredoxin domain-containing protein n=1 Tax=Roseobacter insulae TaxID=2859783 RepID=A0A9X1FV48_9RHOB|nr:cupredoxin domain-containing protein [Roseobacter insulae]MBW4707438.1 cupredoxin domain-containing protein [Roseobacter insulae]
MRVLRTLNRRQFGVVFSAKLLAVAAAPAAGSVGTPARHRVTITSFQFEPQYLEINVGDTIEWTNQDLAPHTATGTDLDWDTGTLARGMSGSVTPATEGVHDYFCKFHPHMTGQIKVTAGG